MAFIVDLHQDTSVLELFEVRRILEPAAASIAASRISAEQLALLRASMATVRKDTSVEDLVSHDLEFHRIIAHASGNSYLANLLDGLSSGTVRARIWRGLTEERAVARTVDEHAAIVEALARGDGELARALLTVHISGVETWLREAV